MAVITGSREPVNKTTLTTHFNSRSRPAPDPVTQTYINLICGLLEQAIDDLRWIEKWDVDSGIYLGTWIKRGEILNFFYSDWFEELCSYALPDFTADEIRYALKVGKFNKERSKEDGTWVSKYYSHH